MSIGAPILSSRSGLVDSLATALRDYGIGSSPDGPPEEPVPAIPLFDFLRIASESGLHQYPGDIAEQGLLAARIGEGLDYVVDKVKDLEGRVVVVKHVKTTASPDTGFQSEDSSRIRKVLHEIKIATHPALKRSTNILQMKGFGWELAEDGLAIPFLVVEYAEHGTLRSYLQRSTVSMETKFDMAFDAARGLQALHAHRIAHGDLKPENALVVSTTPQHLTLKITDFGFSVILKDDQTHYEYWGTPHYRPPEVYRQTGDSETAGLIPGSGYRACDIYTYGLLLLELLIDGEKYITRAKNQGRLGDRDSALLCLLQVMDIECDVLPPLKNIVERCLLMDPEERPQIREIISQLEDIRREVPIEEELTPLAFQDSTSTEDTNDVVNMKQVIMEYEAFFVASTLTPMEPLDLLVSLDDQEEQQLQNILVAESDNREVNPFRVFDAVVQEYFYSHNELTLHQAAYIGNLPRLEELLCHIDDFQDEHGRSALFLAVQGGHLDAIDALLHSGRSDPRLPDEDGHTVLHMLVILSSVEVEAALSMILQVSPELDLNVFSWSPLDASEHWGELRGAPLHWAVLAGNKAMTSCLVKAGARVHGWPPDLCPVRIAVSLHLSEILEILLSAIPTGVSLHGENLLFAISSSNPFRRLLLHGKAYVTEIEKTVSLLARIRPTVDADELSVNDSPLRRLLVVNFSDSDQYMAKALIASGTDIDEKGGWTLLQSAIVGCHGSPLSSNCRIALDMIDNLSDFRRRSTYYKPGWAALHWAAAGGILPVVRKLLQVDPDSINIRTQEQEDRTPLHLAAEDGKSIAVIKLLLAHGADPSLSTSGLKLTPLGSFISSQRSELNNDILKSLLHASKRTGYLALGFDNWNVIHYAAARAAVLDIESLSGHVLLRTLATFPEMKSLIESTTTQGWTPLHLASYFVDYTTIRLLVEEFSACVYARTSKDASAFDIVMERARHCPDNLRGADSLVRWSRLAYRSALFLKCKLEAVEGPYYLTPLHLAAYMGYHDEVVRLVKESPNVVSEINREGETAFQMLQNTLPTNIESRWATVVLDMVRQIRIGKD
ncbi:kinase domain-containing protein [Arthroderma uncinatum]|uniref:kinase domain-containing protein n=1 Tax=Arthroderma uncinatum TaxID=74035 RepID=UPI00144A6E63|nr:kinase domain-containing protein [Arthroderma uncinatum]KAF3491800.1 kinase domain-containing protein [Arthroderma uncinatum]